MTKSEFIDEVAIAAACPRRTPAPRSTPCSDSIKDALKKGGDVAFTGFGKFSVQERKARTGVNPRNPGQKVTIPASNVPKFSAG